MTVIKKDGSKELFDRNKIFVGLMKACDKRSVSRDQMEALVSEIENELQNSLKTEYQSKRFSAMPSQTDTDKKADSRGEPWGCILCKSLGASLRLLGPMR